jgi:uncharacterized membrane protein
MNGPSLGSDPRVASTLAYAAWWVSGLIVWMAERHRPVVRFHAMQSMLVFGAVTMAWALLWLGSFAVLVLSATGFFLLQRLSQFVLVVAALVWLFCLWQAARGQAVRLPYFGSRAARLAATPASQTAPDAS